MRKDAVQSKTCILVNFTIAMKNYQELITYWGRLYKKVIKVNHS